MALVRTVDRRTLGRTALLLALLIAGLLWAMGPPAMAGATSVPPTAHLRADGHVALAWFYGGSSADYRQQIEQMPGLTTISPTWWYLDPDDPGGLELSTDDELVAWARGRGLAVWPLLGNHIDPDLTDQVLRDPVLRQRLVDGVVAETRRSGVDGVNVDFENLHDHTAALLTEFVAELKAAMPDLVISVDVTAMTDTWVLGNWSTAFDREGLGRVADYVMLMAYDQHNSLRRDGPVAGLQWVTESTDFLLRTVPAHKLVLGIPFYSRDWATDPDATDGVALDATLGMAAMARRLTERSQAVSYDPVAGQDLHTYTDAEGRPHRVWLEDVASLGRKTELVASRGLAGVAAWRAGFEQPEVWAALDAQLAAIPAPGSAAEPVPTPAPTEPATAAVPASSAEPAADPAPRPTVDADARDDAAAANADPSPSEVAAPAVTASAARPRQGLALVAAGLLMMVGLGHVGLRVRRRH